MKPHWLSRHISAPGPYLCMCLSEDEYLSTLKYIGVKRPNLWISTPQADATTHYLFDDDKFIVIVCLRNFARNTSIEVAGLLVHEAVHIWQEWCTYYGETNPGSEQEAYAVQSIAQELMEDFARRIKKR